MASLHQSGDNFNDTKTIKDLADVQQHLMAQIAGTKYDCTGLNWLNSGGTNFVFRGILKEALDDDGMELTVIFKYTQAHLARNHTVDMPLDRPMFEEYMLIGNKFSKATLRGNFEVSVPKHYGSIRDEIDDNIQVLEDYEYSIPLSAYFRKFKDDLHPKIMFDIGEALGNWLLNFHIVGSTTKVSRHRELMARNVEMKLLHRKKTYGRLARTIAMFPDLLSDYENIVGEVELRVRNLLGGVRTGRQLVHGNFGPKEILIRDHRDFLPMDITNIWVIDWEHVHLGDRADDVGQMLAELYVHAHFHDEPEPYRSMAKGFIRGYGIPSSSLMYRILTHFGMHLVVNPCRDRGYDGPGGVGYSKKMEAVVLLGANILLSAFQNDWITLRALGGEFLRDLFPQSQQPQEVFEMRRASGRSHIPRSADNQATRTTTGSSQTMSRPVRFPQNLGVSQLR